MITKATNLEAIARIFNHPKVAGWVSDDLSIFPYVPLPEHCYLTNDGQNAAVRVDKLNGITCMVHIGTLPEMRGQTVAFAKEGIAWVFKNTAYVKIVSLAPEFNRAAIVFGKRCGFKIEGKITKSFIKNWELYDQVILGLSKYDREELCQ